MFWSAKSPLEADDEEWQLESWRWLGATFGGGRERPLILPTKAFFTGFQGAGHAAAMHCFRQVAGHFGLDPALFEIIAQYPDVDPILGPLQVVENAPHEPAGTFSMRRDRPMTISYNPALVAKPMQLIATFAHEICHPLLMSASGDPPGGPDMEEFATDLAVTFFGFGIFNANTAAVFRQFSDASTGTQGWSFERQGYLSPAERAFALALFTGGRPGDERDAKTYLEPGALAYYRKSTRYLARNPSIRSALLDGTR